MEAWSWWRPGAGGAGVRANIQPSKALYIPEKRPRNLAHSPLLVGPRRKKQTVVRDSFSLRNLPVRASDSCAQGFSTSLARRRSSCPPPSPNLVRTHPIERYQALRDSAPCLSRAATSRRAPNWNLEDARTWEHHPQPTIIPPPRLNRPAESRRRPVGCISRG